MHAHVDAFAALFPAPLRHVDALGALVAEGWSPGDVHHDPVDEETGWPPPDALRAAGWPLDPGWIETEPDHVFHELPVLPWLGHLDPAEADPLLTIDEMHCAVEMLIEPVAGTPFFGMSWRAGLRLQPGHWLVMSVALHGHYGQPRPIGRVYLAIWAVEGQTDRAVMVLPHGEVYRQGCRRIVGLSQEDLDGALDDTISGSLAF